MAEPRRGARGRARPVPRRPGGDGGLERQRPRLSDGSSSPGDGRAMIEETLNLTLPQITSRMVGAAEAVRLSLDEYRRRNSAWVEAERDHLHARAVARPRLKSKLVADR